MALQLIVKSAESRLAKMIEELRAQPAGWQVVHFHLSLLLEEYKSEYQFKIALNLIHDLLKNHEGSIFTMVDNSILVLCYQPEPLLLEKLIFQLRYLYMDDPLCYDDSGEENPDFCTVYDLKNDLKAVDAVSAKYISMLAQKHAKSEGEFLHEHDVIRPKGTPKLTSAPDHPIPSGPQLTAKTDKHTVIDLNGQQIASIEQMIQTLDMRAVLRRQSVCAILSDMKIRRVFDELYVHIAHVRQMLKSDSEFLTNRWLFKYMTSLLDRRMIDLIKTAPDTYLSSPISINLNVETILSSWFNEFDAAIKPESKVSIVIEVPVVDLFADMGAFKAAMAEIHGLGYRMCLDGLTVESFMHIDREKIGVDLVKVQWNADKPVDLKSGSNAALKDAVKTIGSNRMILCRCDDRSALEYGVGLGISLFQGRYLDKVLNPTAKVEN